jgi:hypothetical protein
MRHFRNKLIFLIFTFGLMAGLVGPSTVGAFAYEVPADWTVFTPIVRLLERYGVDLSADGTDLPALLALIRKRALYAISRGRAAGLAAKFEAPGGPRTVEESAGTEITPGTPAAPVVHVAESMNDLFWVVNPDYFFRYPEGDPKLKTKYPGLSVYFPRYIWFYGDPAPFMDSIAESNSKARGYIYSGGFEAEVDREIMNRVRERVIEEQEFLAWEEEQGLIPTFELPHESQIEFEGRKLFTVGYAHTNYENAPSGIESGEDIQMEGELQLRIEGTVMRKTHVYVDYDDTRENENRNQISVVYKGDPDEVVQEAAFGDIVLSLPATEFVSYSSSKAVFGAKVDLKYRWAELMVIASREKGETEEAKFTGGAELTSLQIQDTEYQKRKYYRLNAGRADDSSDFFENSNVKVKTDVNGIPLVNIFIYRPGKPYDALSGPTPLTAYEFEDNDVFDTTPRSEGHKLRDGQPYSFPSDTWEPLTRTLDYTVDVNSGIVTFLTTVNEEDYLCAAYTVEYNGGEYSVGYDDDGNLITNDMKLLKENGSGGYLQRYELKNRYYLGSTSIQPATLTIKMLDNSNSEKDSTGETYIHKYGLDRTNPPDNRVDNEFIDLDFGLLIVPDDEQGTYVHRDRKNPAEGASDGYNDFLPFDYSDTEDGVVEDYNNKTDAYPPGILNHRYTFHVEYKSLRPSFLLQPNIIPNSETVTLDGVVLVRGRDYWIDYDSGFIEFLIEDVTTPDAVLTITYEYRPFFAAISKSLIGARFEFGPDDDKYVGCTFLGEYSEKPSEGDIPEIGGEPANHRIFDTDFKLEFHPEAITDAIDALPIVNTDEPSTLLAEGEIARSFRNPNIVGRAKVDDMEGAENRSYFPMDDRGWGPSSAPTLTDPALDQSNRQLMRLAKLDGYYLDLIDPDWPRERTSLLEVTNLPNAPFDPDKPARWDSICRTISAVGSDFTELRYDNLRMVFNLNNLGSTSPDDDITGGRIHVEIGEVSEDTDEDGKLDSEDIPPEGELYGDDQLNAGEDIGWEFNNGYETRRIGAGNNKLDEEDLDRDDTLDEVERYYTYAVDLGQVISGTSEYLIRGPNDPESPLEDGWYIVEIPLRMGEGADERGGPDPTKIKHIRIWFESTQKGDFPGDPEIEGSLSKIYFSSINLSAMRWEPPIVDPNIGLNELQISTKSSRNDADYVPLDVYVDPETGTPDQEQSLVLNYVFTDWEDEGVLGYRYEEPEDGMIKVYGRGNGVFDTEDANRNGILNDGEDVGVGPDRIGAGNGRLDQEKPITGTTRITNYSADDYTDYRQIELWTYNFKGRPDTVGAPDANGQDYLVFRFGADDSNYYEYVQQLPDDDAGWRKILINLGFFEKLQAKGVEFTSNNETIEKGNYRVVGNPSLLNVQSVIVGVGSNNPRSAGGGGYLDDLEVWVNNIKLVDPIREIGSAKRLSGDVDLGGFVKLGGGARKIDSGFESIGTVSVAESETTSKNATATLEFGKFMPFDWGVRLPLSGSWSKSETTTEERFDPDQSIYVQGRVVNITRSTAVSFDKYKLPSLDFGYKNARSTNDKYARTSNADTYSASMDYNVFPEKSYLPRNVDVSFTRKIERTRYGKTTTTTDDDRDWRTDDMRSSITMEPTRDLKITPMYQYSEIIDRTDWTEESFNESWGLRTGYDRVKGLTPNFSYSSNYREVVTEHTSEEGGQPATTGTVLGLGGSNLGPNDTMDPSVTSDLTVSCPISVGKLGNDKVTGLNKLTISPSYSVDRSSSYEDLTSRPKLEYRTGLTTLIEGMGEPRTSRLRHSVSLKNRFNPFEFLGARKGTKWESWDFIQADVDYDYAYERSLTTGTPSVTRTQIFPDVTLKLTGTKNFPIAARALERSTVTVGYQRKLVIRENIARETQHTPYISWRATWPGGLRTKADYNYDVTEIRYLEKAYQYSQYDWEREKTGNPAFTVYYDLAMPKGFKIPLIGTLRWRNELNLQGTVELVRTRVEHGLNDNTDQWKYSLSGGYYFTTNLRMDLTGSYTTYHNLSQIGTDYNTIAVQGNFEIIF